LGEQGVGAGGKVPGQLEIGMQAKDLRRTGHTRPCRSEHRFTVPLAFAKLDVPKKTLGRAYIAH
jgi:hypothetical protein